MRRITQVFLAMVLALGLTVSATPETAEAHNGYARFGKGSTIDFCFNPNSGWTSTVLGALRTAVAEIDNNANALTIREVFNGNSCHQWVYAPSNLRITLNSDGCAVMCYVQMYNSLGLAGHEIRINPHKTQYWGAGQQNCIVGINCLTYARSNFQHEIMHWLGFEHPGWSGPNLGSCTGGYHTSWTQIKCDTYGQRLMYAQAGDGYYRTLAWPSYDDMRGLKLWYDW